MKVAIAASIGALGLAFASMPVASADDAKVGVILGFTGPIESLTPDMAESAELALKEVSDSGLLLGGTTLTPVRGDSTCIDSAAATAAAERLITSDNVVAIMGADCSGVTTAIASNVAVPNGVVMVSPSATSPALTTIEDDGYFFRTAPSDARQGEVLAAILVDRGIMSVAVTYTNNDYGKGLSDSFEGAYMEMGGDVVAVAPHEDGKADYSAEVAALAASGAEHLAVFGYVDQGGKGIIQTSIDTGAFESFILADGMIGDSLIEAIGPDLNGTIGTLPGSDSQEAADFVTLAQDAGLTGDCPFCGESYDGAALIALAMQAAGSTDRAAIQSKIMDVANAPGEAIGPGELARGLEILAGGGEIDYVGATGVELTDVGETYGSYKELEVTDGEFVTVQIH
ncbi:MAG: ABC transporter substrate-binding protein [Rhodospirillaceae bacterium]|nr:ABC transporter substrate-binding protein [Rhodospirillaceae bacterium]MBT6511902.1 ABC transporter substrate-binding protein [Rhodospirillaceae bacterium]MBT7648930.1 ABC transporter substrate-binding protein [Rhodospirillaceae bacterium]